MTIFRLLYTLKSTPSQAILKIWKSQILAYKYSPLTTKKVPRISPASLERWRANLNLPSNSLGMSMPSDNLNPTARLPPSSSV